MITALGKKLWPSTIPYRRIELLRRRSTVSKVTVRLRHLAHRKRIIEWCDKDITTIDDGRTLPVGLQASTGIVSSETCLSSACGADSPGSKARIRPAGNRGIEWGSEGGYIVLSSRVLEASGMWKVGES